MAKNGSLSSQWVSNHGDMLMKQCKNSIANDGCLWLLMVFDQPMINICNIMIGDDGGGIPEKPGATNG